MELNNLKLQIESLLQKHKQLGTENSTLRRKLTKLTQERAHLLDKNKNAASRIKRILTQLREEVNA